MLIRVSDILKLSQQTEYPVKQLDSLSEVPEPIGYVYHVSPYANEILTGGFIIDPTKTTLGAFGQLHSISTTDYENAVVYKNAIRFIVGVVNGQLSWDDILNTAIDAGVNDANLNFLIKHIIGEEITDTWNADFDFYKLLTKMKEENPATTAYDVSAVQQKFLDDHFPGIGELRMSEYFDTDAGRDMLLNMAINKTDMYGNAIPEEQDLKRKWNFIKALAHYTDLPVIIGYDPPDHLKNRSMDDVGIVEVAVAPVEYAGSSPKYKEDMGGKYTYNVGEKEWKFYDVNDLWPVRLV